MSAWEWIEGPPGYWSYKLDGAEVTLKKRQAYCDRGHWDGMVFGVPDIDFQDSFPRYYMDETRAKLELSEWLHWRLKRIRDSRIEKTPEK